MAVYGQLSSSYPTQCTIVRILSFSSSQIIATGKSKHNNSGSANHQQLPSLHNIHIWDPSPTLRPSMRTQHLTFTQTLWHAQVLTTFLLHSCARRQESINNPFEWDPAGLTVWNFEHPATALWSITNFRPYPKWGVALSVLRAQCICQFVSTAELLMDYRCQLIRANKCAVVEQLPVRSWIGITGTEV